MILNFKSGTQEPSGKVSDVAVLDVASGMLHGGGLRFLYLFSGLWTLQTIQFGRRSEQPSRRAVIMEVSFLRRALLSLALGVGKKAIIALVALSLFVVRRLRTSTD